MERSRVSFRGKLGTLGIGILLKKVREELESVRFNLFLPRASCKFLADTFKDFRSTLHCSCPGCIEECGDVEGKSPSFSPDLEEGREFLDFPLIVRDAPDEIPLSALASKPRLSPES